VNVPDLARGAGRAVLSSRGRVATAWAVATLLALGALAGEPGISLDEAAVLAGRSPAAAARPAPPLAPALAAAAHAAGARAGLSHLRAARLGTVLAGALLSALLAVAAWELSGGAAALLAPALFWLAPRHLHAGLVATPDLAVAALALAAVLAWRRALAAGRRAATVRGAAVAGLLVGAATLARADAWVLLLALAAHGLGAAALAARSRPRAEDESEPTASAGRAGAAILAALLAAAAVTIAGWPGGLSAGAAAWLPARASGPVRAGLVPLLAIPVPLLWAYAGGALHGGARIARAFRRRVPGGTASDDLLLLAAAAAPLLAAALAGAPRGARPWLPAMPVLALLGARAVVAAGVAWPRRATAVVASVALLLLYPALRATAASFPLGTTAWNELAGGAPGAASAGLPRQDGGDAVSRVLPAVNDRALPGARIWWAGVAPAAIGAYARDGRLRADLVRAAAPEEADLAVVALDGGSRDAEYRAWAALRTARPAAGVYRDEVPLALVYARPGAWR
jgi:hypothetical protein